MDTSPWPSRAAAALAGAAMLLAVAMVLLPWLRTPGTFGFHDWDVATAQRYLTILSLRRFHELPGWNPYACGGFPSWGYAEGAPTLVSPWLPFYLALPLPWALRVEALGMALLGAAGAYQLAGRFSASPAARALVAVVWAANGRWALQLAAGHTWHLAFAWTPWCFHFFDLARGHRAGVRPVAALATCLALQLYAGGIYPLPHTVLALGLYALASALAEKSARPLAVLALGGLLALGLAAPKLLPVLQTFDRAPRWIASNESASVATFWAALTSRAQGFDARPAPVPAYGWHEWGMYLGLPALLAIGFGLVQTRDRRAWSLALVGVVFLALGFGAFGPHAPWTLLHRAPVFRSQHVPARFQYTAVLLLAAASSSGIGRWLARGSARPWSAPLAALVVVLLAVDIASVARQPMSAAMVLTAPDVRWRERFHQVTSSPWHYEGPSTAWVGGPEYLAMRGNVGVIDCYSAPPFGPRGARAAGERGFRGDVWLEGSGVARIQRWSPNQVIVAVRGASPGALLAYNGNAAPGWSARLEEGGSELPLRSHQGALGAVVPGGDATVVFAFRPPGLRAGVLLAALTVASLVGAEALRRRRDRAASTAS